MKLYPPYIEGTIPAFYEESEGTATIVVPFSMNRAVDQTLVKRFHLKMKTVQSNSFVLDLDTDIFNFDNSSTATFKINAESFYNYEKVKNMTGDKFNKYLSNYDKTTVRLAFQNNGGQYVQVNDDDVYDSGRDYWTKKRRFNVGQFYKVQLAFVDQFGEIGYYSTIAVIKFTTKPTVTIEGLQLGAVNLHRRTYIGHYSQSSLLDENALYQLALEYTNQDNNLTRQLVNLEVQYNNNEITEEQYNIAVTEINRQRTLLKQEYQTASNNITTKYRDTTEKEYSYRFVLYDENDGILKDSGTLLHNNSTDLNNYESFDEFTVPLELTEGTVYYLQYTITTNNNLTLSSSKYRLMYAKSVDPEIHAKVITELNYNNGYINVKLEGIKEQGIETNVTGSFLISRSDDKSNFTVWDEINKFNLVGQVPSSWSWKDMTIEHGVKYRYALQQYNENNLYSEKILSVYYDEDGNEVKEPIEAYFEDSFLYDGKTQLKIKYNPKVSSFKTDLMETKIDTIGSKYPFIFRNGAVEYKEFPISGLISYLSDEENLFVSDEELDLTKNFTDWTRKTTLNISVEVNGEDFFFDLENYSDLTYDEVETMRQGYEQRKAEEKLIEEAKQRTTDLLDYNMASERAFKLKVLDWLNNGKIKLFRSPAEGNYIVRLMNVSLSPEDRLGRMLHTFSCNAYEIADCTYDNLMSYKLVATVLNAGRTYKSETVYLIKEENDNNDWRYELIPGTEHYYVISDSILPSHKEIVGLKFNNIPYGYSYNNTANFIINGEEILIQGSNPDLTIDKGVEYYEVRIHPSLHDYLINSFSISGKPSVTVEYYEVTDSLFNTVTNITLDTVHGRQLLGSTEHITQKYLNSEEITDLRKTNTVLIVDDSDDELNYHSLVTYKSDNLLDMLNSDKENVIRFLYARFYKREILDEENDNLDTFIWRMSNDGRTIYNTMTDQIINFVAEEGNAELDLDKSCLYKFILEKGQTISSPRVSVTGGLNYRNPKIFGNFANYDLIFYLDLTHPDVLYYDKYIFERNKSQYSYNTEKTELPSLVMRKINEFNDSDSQLKLLPYDATFSINNGHDISTTYADNEGNTITSRFRGTPFVADSIRLGCGVGLDYCVETQTLSYYVEDNSTVLNGRRSALNNYYQDYYSYKNIINQDYSIDLAAENNLSSSSNQAAIDYAYKKLRELHITRFLVNRNNYTDIDLLKDKAILQIGRELAKWKEETLY